MSIPERIPFEISDTGVKTYAFEDISKSKVNPASDKLHANGYMKPCSIVVRLENRADYYNMLLTGELRQLMEAYYVFFPVTPRVHFIYGEDIA